MLARDDLIIVDDFYQDPDAVRRLALNAKYTRYPGQQAFMGQESVKAYYSPALIERFAELVGSRIDVDPQRWVFGKFRIAIHGEVRTTKVHIDKVDWTAVVYLSPRDRRAEGLGIFRSRQPNLRTVPAGNGLTRLGFATLDEFDADFIIPRTLDNEAWTLIEVIDMQYNRLVLFRGSRLFHAAMDPFGDYPQEGRLSQHFFFNEQDDHPRGAWSA